MALSLLKVSALVLDFSWISPISLLHFSWISLGSLLYPSCIPARSLLDFSWISLAFVLYFSCISPVFFLVLSWISPGPLVILPCSCLVYHISSLRVVFPFSLFLFNVQSREEKKDQDGESRKGQEIAAVRDQDLAPTSFSAIKEARYRMTFG